MDVLIMANRGSLCNLETKDKISVIGTGEINTQYRIIIIIYPKGEEMARLSLYNF